MLNKSDVDYAQSAHDLFAEFVSQRMVQGGTRLVFANVEDKDVYNITAPFMDDGDMVIAGRVERRDSEESEVVFFIQEENGWVPRADTRRFLSLQDPFVCRIRGELIFGGVEIWPRLTNPAFLDYRTVFYRGNNIASLRLFAVGPQGMKDIRLVEMADGNIGVFTRPKSKKIGGNADIGFAVIANFDELTPRLIVHAENIPHRFLPREWGGVNEPHLLRNGKIGVVGHIAYFSEGYIRHYYAMSFVLDPTTRSSSAIKVIAAKCCFSECQGYKRPDLQDILFAGGLIRRDDGFAVLYTGLNDCESHKLQIPDPFLADEN